MVILSEAKACPELAEGISPHGSLTLAPVREKSILYHTAIPQSSFREGRLPPF